VNDAFEENLWGYGRRFRLVKDRLHYHFPHAAPQKLKILDVGCGNGSQLAIPLAALGYQLTAVDPHVPSIERGRSLAPDIKFHVGSVRDLPLENFDCVLISEVLEHLSSPEQLLEDSIRYLAKEGVLIITVPNGYGEFELDRRLYYALGAHRMVDRLRLLFGIGQKSDIAGSDDQSPHIQRFTMRSLRAMFARQNLLLLEARGMSLASGPFVAHLLGKSRRFVELNASITDCLPISLAGGWMFALVRQPVVRHES
jgi:SAM-dependent methyltransferase